MKNFCWDSDEDIESDDEDSFDNVEESNINKKSRKVIKKEELDTKTFNEANFDSKIAKIVVNIHRKQKTTDDFSNWVNKNIEHLKKLHSISNLSCSQIEFYTYIYDNSKNKNTLKI